MRYSLAKPYLKNDNAFLTFPWVFFIAILASFRQGYTVNLPIFFNYTKFNKKLLNTKN
jgi:TRAP-type C4-dicarboxylate transport system permease small subunit